MFKTIQITVEYQGFEKKSTSPSATQIKKEKIRPKFDSLKRHLLYVLFPLSGPPPMAILYLSGYGLRPDRLEEGTGDLIANVRYSRIRS